MTDRDGRDENPAPREEDDQAGAERGDTISGEEAGVLRENWLRALADRDNLRKRMTVQIEAARFNERRAILAAFLNVVDSLDRALNAHQGERNEWIEGTEAVLKMTLDVLKQFGAQPTQVLGELFDPNFHEAVARMKTPDKPEGTIIEVIQPGYVFEDGTILRPAKVVVSHQQD
ncbi:nucleotide exchange factor GrpE [bacterium]|nr:nucleotide exchange factor GrpE [bacterium]